MGIDYYTCCFCDEIYAGDGGSCAGCHAHWCHRCAEDENPFWFDGKVRCTMCFDTLPNNIDTDDLLDYALEKIGQTRSELYDELKLKRPELCAPTHTYTCQQTEPHPCCNKECETLEDEHRDSALSGTYETDYVRGFCCNAKGCDDLCTPCKTAAAGANKKARIE